MRSCAGDWVEVRSKAEILATLDKDGRLEGMPFMPEMFEHCGKRLRVHKRAHKGCDTINPVRSRALPNGVMLEGVRCSGVAHGGCEAQCTVFWKEAWLKPVDRDDARPEAPAAAAGSGCTEEDVVAAALNGTCRSGQPRYRCQATDFPDYTKSLRTLNVGQFAEDLESKNVGVGELVMCVAYFAYDFLFRPAWRYGWPARWLYNRVVGLWGGTPYPRLRGSRDPASRGPESDLDLQPGELVRVKPYEEILKTLDKDNRYRGLLFDAEMVPFCGGVYRVRSRVRRFLDEKTGEMLKTRTPTVILENVWCRSRFSNRRLFCPRAIYVWWREAWLERAPEAMAPTSANALGARAILKDLVREEGVA
jgi:hypothetical protein